MRSFVSWFISFSHLPKTISAIKPSFKPRHWRSQWSPSAHGNSFPRCAAFQLGKFQPTGKCHFWRKSRFGWGFCFGWGGSTWDSERPMLYDYICVYIHVGFSRIFQIQIMRRRLVCIESWNLEVYFLQTMRVFADSCSILLKGTWMWNTLSKRWFTMCLFLYCIRYRYKWMH